MKNLLKILCIIVCLLYFESHIYGQEVSKKYFGFGLGLDYGGYGGKIEFLPVKNFGIFGSLGYIFFREGWNLGFTCKILPLKKVSPNLLYFYGFNGALIVEGASHFNTVSYGVTVGANLDIKVNNKGDKFSLGFFIPMRSSNFLDRYNEVKNNGSISMKNELLLYTISLGFNFVI